MKRASQYFGIIVVVVVMVLVWVALGAGWYLVHRFNAPIEAKRHFLLHDVDYHAVSVACLDMITQPQYKSLIGQFPLGDDPRLPPAIRALKSFWVSPDQSDVLIMGTGGLYHMGLDFHQSASVSNAYELVFQEEDDPPHSHDMLLYTPYRTNDAPTSL